jgi:hypothetical protein
MIRLNTHHCAILELLEHALQKLLANCPTLGRYISGELIPRNRAVFPARRDADHYHADALK